MRADDQDVVVGVSGRHHAREGDAAQPCRNVLTTRILVGGRIGADPEAGGSTGGTTVEVAPEDDGAVDRATCKERPELDALRVVRRHLIALMGRKVRGAHVDADSGADAQPSGGARDRLVPRKPGLSVLWMAALVRTASPNTPRPPGSTHGSGLP